MIVRLKVSAEGDARNALLHFNSMIVRLKGLARKDLRREIRENFNSMIVRLKAYMPYRVQQSHAAFQFYDSPIKRFSSITSARTGARYFNSMIVRLKGLTMLRCTASTRNFNSMIVRLKDSLKKSLKRYCSNFNSMIVRLKVILTL